MSQKKTRRDAIKMSLGVLVGLPAVAALNACTQCSKPADTGAAPEATQSGADAASTPSGETSGMAASTPATEATAAAEGTPAAAGGESLTLISETDPTATALNYKHDAASVPANLQTEKTGVPFAEQKCSNCTFYKAVGQLDGAEVGSCQILAAGKVKAGGWCNSWGKKA